MKDTFEIITFKYGEVNLKQISHLVLDILASDAGGVKSITQYSHSDYETLILDEPNKKVHNGELILPDRCVLYKISYNNMTKIQFSYNALDSTLAFFVTIDLKEVSFFNSNLNEVILSLEPDTCNVTLFKKEKKVWGLLENLYKDMFNDSFLDTGDFNYAAAGYMISFYPPKPRRDKIYIPLPDSFYVNTPAEKVELLTNGYIGVYVTTDYEESLQDYAEKNLRVIAYYRNELEKLGLWRVVKWDGKNWRDTYRQVLKEKGFEV